jgi:hypothetical protein
VAADETDAGSLPAAARRRRAARDPDRERRSHRREGRA